MINDKIATLQEVFAEQREREQNMMFRHNWVALFYNWLIAVTAVALLLSLGFWAVQLRQERRDDAIRAEARAAWEQEQQAAADARAAELAAAQASEEAVIDRESDAVARMFYGIHRFIEKYHYSEADLVTYARCAFNRKDSGNYYVTDDKGNFVLDENGEKIKANVEQIISQKDNFVGYADSNPVLKEYKQLAKELVTEWHNETVKPCDNSYQWAELTPDGIYLKADFDADGYARRWHA